MKEISINQMYLFNKYVKNIKFINAKDNSPIYYFEKLIYIEGILCLEIYYSNINVYCTTINLLRIIELFKNKEWKLC